MSADEKFLEAMASRGDFLGDGVWHFGLHVEVSNWSLSSVGPMFLYAPDYAGSGGHAYVVATGSGGWSLRADRVRALWHCWHQVLRTGAQRREVRWFLYDSETDTGYWATFERLLAVIEHDDRVAYDQDEDQWFIPVECITDMLVVDAFSAAQATDTRQSWSEKRRQKAEESAA